MASLRRLVLGVVRDSIALMGGSPSYGEIAYKLGLHRKRVHKAVQSLERQALLIRRDLHLPSLWNAAIRQLRNLGRIIDEDVNIAPPRDS